MAARIERRHRLVVGPQEVGHAGQGRVGERPGRVRRDHRLPGDVGQHLASLVVDAEQAWRAREPDAGQVCEQRVDSRTGRSQRTADGVADPDHESPVGGAADQHLLVAVHAGRLTRRAARPRACCA